MQGEEESNANFLYQSHKNLYFYRDLMSNSLLFLEKTFPTPGYIMGEAMLCLLPLAGLSQSFLYRILKALQGPRRPAVLSCREGEAAVVPWHPHMVMPKMTACY